VRGWDAEQALIGYTVFQKFQHPVMVYLIEERRDVRINDPVHPSAPDSNCECVQRLMLAAPRSKSV
jgi:hypothetical protein